MKSTKSANTFNGVITVAALAGALGGWSILARNEAQATNTQAATTSQSAQLPTQPTTQVPTVGRRNPTRATPQQPTTQQPSTPAQPTRRTRSSR